MVSESAARKMWPNESPVGKVCVISQRSRTGIGVVKDSGANLLCHPDSVEAYIPIVATDAVYTTIMVHTTRNPTQISGAIRAAAMLPGVISAGGEFSEHAR